MNDIKDFITAKDRLKPREQSIMPLILTLILIALFIWSLYE